MMFPSPAPNEFKHLRQPYGVGVLLSGVMSPPCSQIRIFPPDSPRGSSAAHRSRIVRVALSKALVSYHTDDRTKHLAGMMDDGLLLVTNAQGLLSPNAIEPFKPPDDIECGLGELKSEFDARSTRPARPYEFPFKLNAVRAQPANARGSTIHAQCRIHIRLSRYAIRNFLLTGQEVSLLI